MRCIIVEHIVKIQDGNGQHNIELKAAHGQILSKVLGKASSEVAVEYPCGGRGRCGGCRVVIKAREKGNENSVDIPCQPQDVKLLTEEEIKKGMRLACCFPVLTDIDVYIGSKSDARILTQTENVEIVPDPLIQIRHIIVEEPTLGNQAGDFERLKAAMGEELRVADVQILKKLTSCLRNCEDGVSIIFADGVLLDIECTGASSSAPVKNAPDTKDIAAVGADATEAKKTEAKSTEAKSTEADIYGLAVDIGTTTLVIYLCHLYSGRIEAVRSLYNPQRKYGADVLSRIDFASSSEDAAKEMTGCLIDALNLAVSELCEEKSIDRERIMRAVFAGNTTMTHFLLGLPAANIAVSPFIPVTTSFQRLNAAVLGLDINKNAYCDVLPGVSAYIGADIAAAILSTEQHKKEGTYLLIDLGTNGEIVLGGSNGLLACSTAAGPAFEGAGITMGMSARSGAVDTVSSSFGYTVIGDSKPVGICGSGLVDAVAAMLQNGVLDETGRIIDREECADRELAKRLINYKGINSIEIIPGSILITQKDIRALQSAKAAVAAGIRILMKAAGVGKVDAVYLAGGFGNYVNIENAVRIGLIPDGITGSIEYKGNAAGYGAVKALLLRNALAEAADISKNVKYIELSDNKDFFDIYIDEMSFNL